MMRCFAHTIVTLGALWVLSACEDASKPKPAVPAKDPGTAKPGEAAKTENPVAAKPAEPAQAAKAEAPKPEAPKPEAPKPAETPPAAKTEAPKPAETPPAAAAEPKAPDAAITALEEFIKTQKIDTAAPGWKTKLPQPPKVNFTASKTYYWNLQTNKGPVKVKLMPQVAPMHVSSTIYLTLLKFYDGLKFHRVIPGFMAQGGDPLGSGGGGPGYKYSGEFSPNVRHNRPGLLSMANAGPGTDGSQFFLTFAATPHLDGRHTIFGEVVEGMDTLKKLEAAGSPSGPTSEPLLMEKCTVSVE